MEERAGTWGSSIGIKTIMALTGVALLLFLIAHLLGNLQIFLGPEALNGYAKKLKSLPGLLWTLRIGLLAIFLLHVVTAVILTARNRVARPVRYRAQEAVQVGYASRTLIWTGSVVLAFIVYHLLHFTFGATDPQHFGLHDSQGRHDVYSMVVLGFSQLPVALSYIVANVLLGFHLSHGIASFFQTLGLSGPRHAPLLRKVGWGLALAIVIGNVSMPLAVLLGYIAVPAGGP